MLKVYYFCFDCNSTNGILFNFVVFRNRVSMSEKPIIPIEKPQRFVWIYLLKNLIGATICFFIFKSFPEYPLFWSLISVVVVFTPDNSNQLAYDRIKSNFLGASIGLSLSYLPIGQLYLLLLGLAITILVAFSLKLDKTIRPALAAIVIVLFENQTDASWLIPLERVLCVTLGCLVALLITYSFSKIEHLFKKSI